MKNESYDKYGPCGDVPDRQGAREVAATLCFTILRWSVDVLENKIQPKLTTDVQFVVAHAATSGPRIRTHIWRAFQDKGKLSQPQYQRQVRAVVDGRCDTADGGGLRSTCIT